MISSDSWSPIDLVLCGEFVGFPPPLSSRFRSFTALDSLLTDVGDLEPLLPSSLPPGKVHMDRDSLTLPSDFVRPILDVAVGFGHIVFLADCRRNVFGMGLASHGQLGVGGYPLGVLQEPCRAKIRDDVQFIHVGCGRYHTVCICDDGNVYSCGDNSCGQLGLGHLNNVDTFQRIPFFEKNRVVAKRVFCSEFCTIILDNRGRLWGFGSLSSGHLYFSEVSSSFQSTPRLLDISVKISRPILQVVFSDTSTLVLCDDGKLWIWGKSNNGNIKPPLSIPNSSTLEIMQIAAGDSHFLALSKIGELYVWGESMMGALGIGESELSATDSITARVYFEHGGLRLSRPHKLLCFHEPIAMIGAGSLSSWVITATGRFYWWGSIGEGAPGAPSTPVEMHPQIHLRPPEDILFIRSRYNLLLLGFGARFTSKCPAPLDPWSGITRNENSTDFPIDSSLTCCLQRMRLEDIQALVVDDSEALAREIPEVWHEIESNSSIVESTLSYSSEPDLSIRQSTQTTSVLPEKRRSIGAKQTRLKSWIWGENILELSTEYRASDKLPYPVRFDPLNAILSIQSVSCGSRFLAYVTENGELYTIGFAGRSGALGHGDSISELAYPKKVLFFNCPASDEKESIIEVEPTDGCRMISSVDCSPVPPVESSEEEHRSIAQENETVKISNVSCGGTFVLATSTDGNLYSWGTGHYGELGLGSTLVYSSHPRRLVVPLLPLQGTDEEEQGFPPGDSVQFSRVVAGFNHCLALSDSGELFSWGLGRYGQLGFEEELLVSSKRRSSQSMVPELSLASAQSGEESGGSVTLFEPSRIDFFSKRNMRSSSIVDFVCGRYHSLVLLDNGNVYSFGQNNSGQCGVAPTPFADTVVLDSIPRTIWCPTLIRSLRGKHIVALGCGSAHSCALSIFGDIYVWGSGNSGRLGNGSDIDVWCPLKISMPNQDPIESISNSCTAFHTLAKGASGIVYSWGHGSFGQLGHGTEDHFATPEVVARLQPSGDGVETVRSLTELPASVNLLATGLRLSFVSEGLVPDIDGDLGARSTSPSSIPDGIQVSLSPRSSKSGTSFRSVFSSFSSKSRKIGILPSDSVRSRILEREFDSTVHELEELQSEFAHVSEKNKLLESEVKELTSSNLVTISDEKLDHLLSVHVEGMISIAKTKSEKFLDVLRRKESTMLEEIEDKYRMLSQQLREREREIEQTFSERVVELETVLEEKRKSKLILREKLKELHFLRELPKKYVSLEEERNRLQLHCEELGPATEKLEREISSFRVENESLRSYITKMQDLYVFYHEETANVSGATIPDMEWSNRLNKIVQILRAHMQKFKKSLISEEQFQSDFKKAQAQIRDAKRISNRRIVETRTTSSSSSLSRSTPSLRDVVSRFSNKSFTDKLRDAMDQFR